MSFRAIGRMAALAAALLVFAGSASAEALRNWRIAFEVLSSQHAQPAGGRKASYAEKDALTRAVLAEIVPHVWTTLGAVVAARVRSRVQAGGYGNEVNPSIHSAVQTTEAEARRLSAALGFVFRQDAVLMYDLAAEDGQLKQVTVRFARRSMTPAIAARFFDLARQELKNDKLGFSSTLSRMIFININTGIGDDALAAGLKRAAAAWPQQNITVEPPKSVRALLVENDWSKQKAGESYASELGAGGERLAGALAMLQRRHDGRVRRWVAFLHPARKPPQPAPGPPQQ
jgi:hypothetical protein